MVKIDIEYKGNLRCSAVHEPSGTEILTDAPKDNHGMGASFSPTDLLATSLGTCILSVMGIAARGMNVDLSGAKVTVNKEMVSKPIRRVAKLTVVLELPVQADQNQKQQLEKAALECPVHHSLHPSVEKNIEFRWA